MGVDDYLDEALEENVHDGDDDCSQDDSNASRLSRDVSKIVFKLLANKYCFLFPILLIRAMVQRHQKVSVFIRQMPILIVNQLQKNHLKFAVELLLGKVM